MILERAQRLTSAAAAVLLGIALAACTERPPSPHPPAPASASSPSAVSALSLRLLLEQPETIVGGGLPLAVGLALADRLQGVRRVTLCVFGEGAMAEGAFHESINLAALWQLPVLFCCENNLYAMGTALARSESQTDLCAKAASYRVATFRADGMDVRAVFDTVSRAVRQVREGGGPAFVELQTYRFRAHSMFDPDLYRDKAEIEEWKQRGPIHSLSAQLKAEGRLDEEAFLALDAEAEAEVAAAVAFAEQAPWEPVADLLKDVHTPAGAAAGGAP